MDEKMIYDIYLPYLKKLDEAKRMLLDKYKFMPMIKSHPGFVKKTKEDKRKVSILERVEEKLIYLQGKKKDIIELKGQI